MTRAAEETTGPWPPYDDGGDLWGGAGGKVGVGRVGREFLAAEAAKGGDEEGQGADGGGKSSAAGAAGAVKGDGGNDEGEEEGKE